MVEKWTPGPWRIQNSGWATGTEHNGLSGGVIEAVRVDDSRGKYVIGEDGQAKLHPHEDTIELAHFIDRNSKTPRISRDELRANAQLMAAAPDMAEALANIENDDGRIPESIWKMRTAALAKARGEIGQERDDG